MRRILLTGGSGFIGRNIRESFLAQKYEIIAPSHSDLDLLDTDSVDAFFSKNSFDCVLHAGVKPGHRNAKDTSALLYSNLRMFQNLERNKDSFGKFINFGSGAIYDQSSNITAARETSIFKKCPKDEHGFCKYTEAKLIANLPNFVDLVIFGIFGKYEDWQIRFISNAVCKAVCKMPITLRQNRRFSYLDVDDLPQILECFIENSAKYKEYNIAPDGHLQLLSLAELVRREANADVEIKLGADGFGYDYYADNSRLLAEFPSIKFKKIQESIANLCKYYKDNISKIDRSELNRDK